MTTGTWIAAIGLALSIVGSVWKLCSTITKNTDAVTSLTGRIDRMDIANAKIHDEIKTDVAKNSAAIADHEARLKVIEHVEHI